MATKRLISAASAPSSQHSPKRRKVTQSTFKRCQTQHEKEYQTLSWLSSNSDGKTALVDSLWCAVCTKFEDRICSAKNFSCAWVVGSTNQKLCNVLDHARSDQHKAAITQLCTEQAKAANAPVTSYAPIEHSLLSMDKTVHDRMMKFDICFVMAKENMAFQKYPALHELETRHGVDLG